MLLSLFYGMQSCFVLLWKYDLDFFLVKDVSIYIHYLLNSRYICFFAPLSLCFSLYWHIFYLWHIVRFFSDDYKSPVFVDISLSKCWSDHKLPIGEKNSRKKEDATKLMIERKKLTKLYNLKKFKSRNKHND